MSIAVVVGNPKAGSRTLRVALAVADAFQGTVGASTDPLVVELAALGPELFDLDSPAVDAALDAVAHSDLLVVASPTYKATYTGLLKSFFDRYSNDALAGTVSDPRHDRCGTGARAGARGPPPPAPGRAGQLHPDAGALRDRAAIR